MAMPVIKLTCPACRKPNELDLSSVRCLRCGCDLRMLVQVAAAASRHRDMAKHYLSTGDYSAARLHAQTARKLHATDTTTAVAKIAGAAARARTRRSLPFRTA